MVFELRLFVDDDGDEFVVNQLIRFADDESIGDKPLLNVFTDDFPESEKLEKILFVFDGEAIDVGQVDSAAVDGHTES